VLNRPCFTAATSEACRALVGTVACRRHNKRYTIARLFERDGPPIKARLHQGSNDPRPPPSQVVHTSRSWSVERSFGSHAERSMPGSTSKGDQLRQQSLDYRTRTELRAGAELTRCMNGSLRCHPRGFITGLKLMASPMRCDDTMIVPRRAACRHGNESMIQMLRSLTEEDHRQCLVGESAWDGER
jgi:hypothetical protein